MTKITHERLRHLLNYDPETGLFTRRVDTARGRFKAGTVAGSVCGRYRVQWIDGEPYLEHRIAWFWMTGRWPNPEVDHENLDGVDNRWVNLREASLSQNAANRRRPSNNTSGHKGVRFVKDPAKCGSKPWRASIMKDGHRHYIGLFETAEEAGAAYRAAALRLHGEFGRAA